jgi:hypothetical protein
MLTGWDIKVTGMAFDNLTCTLYNVMFMDAQFWSAIDEEHILIFQTDCIMFRGVDPSWLRFDYVGANYYTWMDQAPRVKGIQGGFSLRRKSAMLRCIQDVPVHKMQMYRELHRKPHLEVIKEDVYFTHACEILELNVPSEEDRPKFSLEVDYYPYTVGHHGFVHGYFTTEQAKELIQHARKPTTYQPEDRPE